MKITGKVATIIYKNESNAYTVILLKSGTSYITVVGETNDIEVGDEIELEGIYEKHKNYGEQFKFSTCFKVMPKDSVNLISYIAENIKGVGKKTAKNIIDEFGEDTVDVIRFSKEKLLNIKGLNEEKINTLSDFFNTEWEKWNIIKYLSEFGMSVVMANKVYQNLGTDTINIVKENPYSLLDFVKSLDFKSVDEIGLKVGISEDNSKRISYGILFALSQTTEFGHTCIDLDSLVSYASKMLCVSDEKIKDNIINLKMEEKVYLQNIDNIDYIFRKSFYLAEKNIAQNIILHTIAKQGKKSYNDEIERSSQKENLVLSDEQKEAIKKCLNSNISIVTGGPGTGKTTIIRCLIDILEMANKSYVLCAPTGRAAKRITETTGKEAKTLHRLLEITKLDDKDLDMFLDYNVKNIETDVVIVDEASMIDTLMMNNLLKAIKPDTKLILVGDVDQLPSVGPGSVLKDIIESNVVNTVYLKQIYRQSSISDIILNAHRVNKGEYPEFKKDDTDLFFSSSNSIEDVLSEISSLLSYRLESYAKLDILKDVQILTPMKKNELGTFYLNRHIQDILNRKSSSKNQKEFNGKIFREGDKVMQIVNNYDRKFSQNGHTFEGVYNGDIGYVKEVNFEFEYLTVVFDDNKEVEYSFDELEELELAYAVTIHKSQGSEFDYVILPLFTGYPKLFTRNLLYTAMTRAKKMLIIIGSRRIVNFMVDNIDEKNRKTGLKNQILSLL